MREGIYDEFVHWFAARVDAMTIGDPIAEPAPDLGPCAVPAAELRPGT